MSSKSNDMLLFLGKIATASFIAGLFLAVIGLVIVFVDPLGEVELIFFGHKLKSDNMGIAAIFIGATLIAVNIKHILKSFDAFISSQTKAQEGKKAPGEIHLSDIQLIPDKYSNSYVVDFRVSNNGGSDLLINAVKFELLDIVTVEIKGFLAFSKIYDLDISELEKIGDTITANVSQVIKPGESDRFGIKIIATKLPPGVERGWQLLPSLSTNFGEIEGKQVEVWFPCGSQPYSNFEEMKEVEKIEKSARNTIKKDSNNVEMRDQEIEEIAFDTEGLENTLPAKNLLAEPDLGKIAKFLESEMYSSHNEEIQKIVNSEKFGKSIIKKITESSNLKDITLCLDAIKRTDKNAVDNILQYRDFGLTVLPVRINDEPDIENIGLCLAVLSNCAHNIARDIIEFGYFNTKGFIKKLNAEPDVGKIGHCIDTRIFYTSPSLAKSIVESEEFDKKHLIEKLNAEQDNEKISACIVGIDFASKKVADDLYYSLRPEMQKILKEKRII